MTVQVYSHVLHTELQKWEVINCNPFKRMTFQIRKETQVFVSKRSKQVFLALWLHLSSACAWNRRSWSDFASQPTRQPKKWGSRGGVRNRVRRRGNRLALPAITFSSVRSLSSKMTELAVLVKYDRDYRQSRLICVTMSWLTGDSTGTDLDGFTPIRFRTDLGKCTHLYDETQVTMKHTHFRQSLSGVRR